MIEGGEVLVHIVQGFGVILLLVGQREIHPDDGRDLAAGLDVL